MLIFIDQLKSAIKAFGHVENVSHVVNNTSVIFTVNYKNNQKNSVIYWNGAAPSSLELTDIIESIKIHLGLE